MPAPVNPKPNGRVEVYTQEPMVNWLGPMQCVQTGLRSLIAVTLGAFADPREVQAALNPPSANPCISSGAGAGGTLWIDYVADTGDGWDSTYSVAWCLSRKLVIGAGELPRADVLLLGGDQVYPTPAHGGYRSRFVDPFRSALPAAVPAQRAGGDDDPVSTPGAPLMMATPGNHDWYDGLRAFTQLFCSRKPVGQWRTEQRTSYYVLNLPNGWWVWGLDLQMESAMDRPQREYFAAMAARLLPGDRVIVCAPEPSWVEESNRVEREDKAALSEIETRTPRFLSLKEIEESLGEHLALVLAGDSHHYARYAPAAASGLPQRITCGGGGAFLNGTHQLERKLRFFVSGAEQCFELACRYPTAAMSKALRNKAWRMPMRNPSFCALLAVFYLLFAWVLQTASHPGAYSLIAMLSTLSFPEQAGTALSRIGFVMAHSPASVLLAAAIVAGAAGFTCSGAKGRRGAAFCAGALHGVLHLLLAFALLWVMGRFNRVKLAWVGTWLGAQDTAQVALFFIETLTLGGLLGGLLFGVWLVAANAWWGLHGEEVFSSQRIADRKCFLRMRIDGSGLTIFPLKIDRVCRHWKVSSGIEVMRRAGTSWRLRAFAGSGARFEPARGELRPELIEPPIHIPKSSRDPS